MTGGAGAGGAPSGRVRGGTSSGPAGQGTPSGLVPAAFDARRERGPRWATWLDDLPRLAREVLDDWALTRTGDARYGESALVLPVRTDDGTGAVLKLTWPHPEAAHEHLALRHWGGAGAVELLRADPHRWALLLERIGPRDLTTVDVDDACRTVGGLYGHLHRPAPPRFRRLSAEVADWGRRLAALPRDAPVPHRLVEHARSLCRAFADDAATDGRLVHGDLHFDNVLAAERAPWLAIDPKPLSGDPHLEPAPLLWNRWAEAVASGDVRWALNRRLDVVTDVAGLDPDRVRDWVVVREAVNALWVIEDAERLGRALTGPEQDHLTRAVTVTKAVRP